MKIRRLIFGIIVVVLGALMLVQAMGFIELGWAWLGKLNKYILPVLLLVIGAKIIESYNRQAQHLAQRELEPGTDGKRLAARLVCSGSQYAMNGKEFPGADLDLMFAGAKLDLRGANIVDGAILNVKTLCGGLELWVSPDIYVEVHSVCFAGGVANHVMSRPNPEAKTIVLNANCYFGGVDVKE